MTRDKKEGKGKDGRKRQKKRERRSGRKLPRFIPPSQLHHQQFLNHFPLPLLANFFRNFPVPLGPRKKTIRPFGGDVEPPMILGRRHGQAEALVEGRASRLGPDTSFPTRSGVRADQEANRRTDTEMEVQPKPADWKIHRRGASPSCPGGPMALASLPQRVSPSDGRLSAEGYKFPARVRWSFLSFLFSFLSFPAGPVCSPRPAPSNPSYIAAPTLTKDLLILQHIIV